MRKHITLMDISACKQMRFNLWKIVEEVLVNLIFEAEKNDSLQIKCRDGFCNHTLVLTLTFLSGKLILFIYSVDNVWIYH